ncbi:MAG: hypothetical protein ACRD6B_11480 [Bryobacteraceae bacterium]
MNQIDREHPDFKRQQDMLRMYRDLYVGGSHFRAQAAHYLLRRQKEPLDVYSERLFRVFYENYIGSIIDWYPSTLFRRGASLQFESGDEASRHFLTQFTDDCDLRGTSLSEFLRQCLSEALVAGRSHILLDFPRVQKPPANRAEEDAAGLSRAYLVCYRAEDLINWSLDERGEYEWVVLRKSIRRQPRVDSPKEVEETYWYYFDKSSYRIYRRVEDSKDHNAPISLIAQGSHALVLQQKVPLFTLETSDSLWLMNKAAHLQLEHFNKSNALSWAITMGLFAMPVIYSEREWSQIVGESYYIQLGPQDRFGWTEPDGKVYQIAASNLETLKEEIYRVCYLSQASGETQGGRAQSALSKQLDFTITREILQAYGTVIKQCAKKILSALLEARGDHATFSISGLDEVDIADFGTELEQASALLKLGVNSPTLKRLMFQRLAFKYLNDLPQESKEVIAREIDAQIKS